MNNLEQPMNIRWTSGPKYLRKDRLIPNHGANPMKTTLLTIAVSLTIGSATTSYHLSSLPTPTDAQKNLITAFNAIFAAGTTAVFGLLNDKDE
jgi:hypothetical protein